MPEKNGLEEVTLTCKSCRHAIKHTNGMALGKWVAECRESPPQVIAVTTGQGINISTLWPVVSDSPAFYCSKHEKTI